VYERAKIHNLMCTEEEKVHNLKCNAWNKVNNVRLRTLYIRTRLTRVMQKKHRFSCCSVAFTHMPLTWDPLKKSVTMVDGFIIERVRKRPTEHFTGREQALKEEENASLSSEKVGPSFLDETGMW